MKRFLALLMSLCLLLTLAACGKPDSAPESGSSEQTTTREQQTPSETTQPPETTQPVTEPLEDGWQEEHNDAGELVKKIRYENGVAVEALCFENGEQTHREVYTYAASGALSCMERFGKDDTLTLREGYCQGELRFRREFFYDDRGGLCGCDTYDARGNLTDNLYYDDCALTTEVYQKNGITLRKDTFTHAGLLYQVEVHDEDWNLYEYYHYENGVEDWKRINTYNEHGKITESVYYEKGVAIERTVYTYDAGGSLLEKVTCLDGQEEERCFYTCEGDRITELRTVRGVAERAVTRDGEDRVVVDVRYQQGKPVWRNTFRYDAGGVLAGYDSELLGQQGPLKKVTLTGGDWYEDFFDGGEEESCVNYIYDQNGALVKAEPEPVYEDLEHRIFYIYDDKDNLVAIYDAQSGEYYGAGYDDRGRIVWEFHEYGGVSDSESYEYDDANGTYTSHFIGATYGHTDSQYDENGRLTLMIAYGDGSEEYRVEYQYNQYGDVERATRTESLYSSEVIYYAYQYEYQNGKWVSRVVIRDGEEDSRTTRTYDAKGNLTEEIEDGVKTVCTYDAQGRLIQKVCGGEDTCTWLFRYDEQGRLLEEICFSLGD